MPGCNKENPPYPETPRLTLVRTPAPITRQGSRGQWSVLMARAQDGDREAYRTLLTEVEPYVRSIAVKYLGSSSDLEDAVQDVLMTVHSIRQTYDPKRPFGPWLVAIAHRRIIDQLRRQLRRRSRETELSTEHETLLHNLDATIMILIWNLSTAALIAGMASALGRPLLAWVAGHVMPLLPPQLSSK